MAKRQLEFTATTPTKSKQQKTEPLLSPTKLTQELPHANVEGVVLLHACRPKAHQSIHSLIIQAL